jgi:hypothetical protein
MDTTRPIESYVEAGTGALAKALAVGLAWPTGSKIFYLVHNSDLVMHLPSSYAPIPVKVMWRVEVSTTGSEQHEQTVADVMTALRTLAQVDTESIDVLDLGGDANGLYQSQVFFHLRQEGP